MTTSAKEGSSIARALWSCAWIVFPTLGAEADFGVLFSIVALVSRGASEYARAARHCLQAFAVGLFSA